LLAALAGIGFALGGFEALLPVSGDWHDSGWVKVFIGAFSAIVCGSALSWTLARAVIVAKLVDRIPERWWRRMQIVTVCFVSSGHGFNDGLKYVGIFTLVLVTSGVIPSFEVMPWVIGLCAFVMGIGTLIGGWRIHRRLDLMVNHPHPAEVQVQKKSFQPFMGVTSELVSGFLIWQTGWLGIPTSTNHATVSAMAGARSASGKIHSGSLIRILWGWVVTYIFCFWCAELLTRVLL
jgi:PiT family inorganic phosphate transporter